MEREDQVPYASQVFHAWEVLDIGRDQMPLAVRATRKPDCLFANEAV